MHRNNAGAGGKCPVALLYVALNPRALGIQALESGPKGNSGLGFTNSTMKSICLIPKVYKASLTTTLVVVQAPNSRVLHAGLDWRQFFSTADTPAAGVCRVLRGRFTQEVPAPFLAGKSAPPQSFRAKMRVEGYQKWQWWCFPESFCYTATYIQGTEKRTLISTMAYCCMQIRV